MLCGAVHADHRAYPVLFVDDEPANLVAFQYTFEPEFAVVTAGSGAEALAIIREYEIAVLIADHKMPDMDGVTLCERARALRPETVRMIVTAYSDIDATTDAINRGGVSHYVRKPWHNDRLAQMLRTTIDVLHVQRVVRQMELRVLHGDEEQHATRQKYRELVHELTLPFRAVKHGVEGVVAALGSAREALEGASSTAADRALALLAEANEHLAAIAPAIDQIEAIETAERRAAMGAGQVPAQCDCARAIRAAVRIAERSLPTGVRVHLELEENVIVPLGAVVVGQLISNLVSNAAAALQEAASAPDRKADLGPPIAIGLRADGQEALLTVTDAGPGIAPADVERIFEPHFTTKDGGTGLGLSIVRDLVERVSGSVVARSPPGNGATFEVRLPLR